MEIIRGHAELEIKAFGEGKKGLIRGRLSHIAPDRSGDIVMPKGLKFRLPLPLRFEHRETVGTIFAANVTDKDVEIEAQLADPDEAKSATIKERLLAAWDSVTMGLARGLSVGMLPIKHEPSGIGYGRKFFEAELVEGSIVSIPDNARASISVIKSFSSRTMPRDYSRLDDEIIRRVTRSDGAVHL
jgi:uncharacterized protein